MYPSRELDKVLNCSAQKTWHLFGQCPVCRAQALRFSLLQLDRVYSVEDQPHLVEALHYLRSKYPDQFIKTRREVSMPIFSTSKPGENGFVYKAEFLVGNTLVFIERRKSKVQLFNRVREHVKSLGCNSIFLIHRNGTLTEHSFKKTIPPWVEIKVDRRKNMRLKRLVNPANPSDVYYVPWNELKPLVEMYDGDRDRAERRWWRRKIKQRNKQYSKP